MRKRQSNLLLRAHRAGLSRCLFALIAGILAQDLTVSAADNRDRFEPRVYECAGGGSLPYRLLKPKDYDPKRKYPLVLFFHGAGERGDDNRRQLIHGMNEFASEEMMEKYPCFVVAPQCPNAVQWVDTPWTLDAHTMPGKPTTPMRMSLDLLSALEKEFSVDARRIYVTGLSMGGFGTWDAIQRHPDRFAAAVPVCGGADVAKAKDIAHIPVWVFHGDSDGVVKTRRSRDMVAALKKAGGSPQYTEYPNTGHNAWKATYSNPEMYEWLFAQRKAK